MHPRKQIGIIVVLVIGLTLGYFFKNIKEGMIIGLALGLLGGGLLSSRK